MADVDTGLTVRFSALGRETTNVTEWEIDSAYLVSTDGFRFRLFEEDQALITNLEFQPVDLIVNGATQLAGRIDQTVRGETAKTIRCEGRDYIAELVECNVDPLVKVAAGDTLETALRNAMSPCGITVIIDASESVALDTRLGMPKQKRRKSTAKRPRKTKPLSSDYKAKPGEGIYEFCKRITDRLGTTMQPDVDRSTVILSEPDYTQAPWYAIKRTDDTVGSASNNVISATATRDYSSFPTYALFTGNSPQTGDSAGNRLDSEFNLVDYVETVVQGRSLLPQMQTVVDLAEIGRRLPNGKSRNTNKIYRLLYYRDQDAKDPEQIDNAIVKAVAELLKDSLSYTVTVRGHVEPESGAIWTVNTMCEVNDSTAGINENLWIARRTLKYSPNQGATTDLEMWRPGAFVITADTE
jgi:prophage tail gpP-like protein